MNSETAKHAAVVPEPRCPLCGGKGHTANACQLVTRAIADLKRTQEHSTRSTPDVRR